MSRADFEALLFEDENFRQRFAELSTLAQRVRDSSQRVKDLDTDLTEARTGWHDARAALHQHIRRVVGDGAVKSAVARQVGLSPQRINSIVHEGTA